MSTIRERLTTNATTLFNTTFDKDVFLEFVEEFVYLALVVDRDLP